MRINEEMIIKLGLSMIDIGFITQDIDAALNAIMHLYTLETIANIPIPKKKGTESE